MKQSTIQIHDARRKGGKGYRVRSVAKNGEILQSSEVLESENAVKKNIEATSRCYDAFTWKLPCDNLDVDNRKILDFTTSQVFAKKGWAKEGKKTKK
jgi:uncharacterized protein YegP (UPF0339 family)